MPSCAEHMACGPKFQPLTHCCNVHAQGTLIQSAVLFFSDKDCHKFLKLHTPSVLRWISGHSSVPAEPAQVDNTSTEKSREVCETIEDHHCDAPPITADEGQGIENTCIFLRLSHSVVVSVMLTVATSEIHMPIWPELHCVFSKSLHCAEMQKMETFCHGKPAATCDCMHCKQPSINWRTQKWQRIIFIQVVSTDTSKNTMNHHRWLLLASFWSTRREESTLISAQLQPPAGQRLFLHGC